MSRRYSTKSLNFIAHNLTVDSDGGMSSRSWMLISAFGEFGNKTINNFKFGNQEENASYSFIKMNFIIERHNKELIFQIVIPAIVLIIFNLITLFLPVSNERWILYAMNLFNHHIYIIQLRHMMPANADSIPNAFTFFCNSKIITVFLMIESLMMHIYVTTKSVENSNWILTIYDFIGTSRFNNIVKIVDVQKDELRMNFSKIIDHILIVTLIICYFIMCCMLMPKDKDVQGPKVLFFENDY